MTEERPRLHPPPEPLAAPPGADVGATEEGFGPAGPSLPRGPAAASWSATDAVLGVVIGFFVLSIGGAIVIVIAGGTDSLGATLGAQGVLEATLIGVALAYAIARGPGLPPLAQLGLRRFAVQDVGLALGAFLAYLVLSAIYVTLVAQPEQEDLARDLGFDEGVAAAIAAGIAIVAVAPIAEEVFFRGFFFAGLGRGMPIWAAALLSGVLFGAIHLQAGNLAIVPQLSLLGVLLAWLYVRTGSLWPPILVHGLNNGLAFAVLVG